VAAAVVEQAADQGQHAHRQGHVEAVPDGEPEVRHLGLQDGAGGGDQDCVDGELRQQANQQHQGDEDVDRHAHPARRLVRDARQVASGAAEEDLVDEAGRVGDREHAGDRGEGRQRIGGPTQEGGVVDGLDEEHLLGQEPVHRAARRP
jgi:hypothetical protein